MQLTKILLCSIPSDSHTWNLVYLQMWLEERGYEVLNIGCCSLPKDIISGVRRFDPDLVVISTVNGHGAIEGLGLINALRREEILNNRPIVIGGKLAVDEKVEREQALVLESAGFDGVFIGPTAVSAFSHYLRFGRTTEPILSAVNTAYGCY